MFVSPLSPTRPLSDLTLRRCLSLLNHRQDLFQTWHYVDVCLSSITDKTFFRLDTMYMFVSPKSPPRPLSNLTLRRCLSLLYHRQDLYRTWHYVDVCLSSITDKTFFRLDTTWMFVSPQSPTRPFWDLTLRRCFSLLNHRQDLYRTWHYVDVCLSSITDKTIFRLDTT
jgi:hypothetical protein